MRVLHIGKYYHPFTGGIERFMGELLAAQNHAGLTPAAIVHHHQTGRATRHETVHDTPIDRVRCHGRWLYTPLSPGFGYQLARVIRAFKPDLLHIHMPNPSALWSLAIEPAKRLPWVVHWHSDVVSSSIDPRLTAAYHLYRPFEQRLLARSRAIIVTSPPYLRASRALDRWRSRCHVIPLGLPASSPPIPPVTITWAQDQWPPGALKVLAIGRLTYYKGFHVLIRAVAASPGAALLLVGSGTHHDELQTQMTRSPTPHAIRMLGSLPQDRVRALLQTCDCLCLPSLERSEAFGLVLLEAMRQAKPVIASDIPGSGVGWVAVHQQTGLLAPPQDHQALATAMTDLASDPARCRRMGQAGRDRFLSLFQIHRISDQITQLYHTILT